MTSECSSCSLFETDHPEINILVRNYYHLRINGSVQIEGVCPICRKPIIVHLKKDKSFQKIKKIDC